MKRLISIAIGAVGLCLSGCASETVENRQEIQLRAGLAFPAHRRNTASRRIICRSRFALTCARGIMSLDSTE